MHKYNTMYLFLRLLRLLLLLLFPLFICFFSILVNVALQSHKSFLQLHLLLTVYMYMSVYTTVCIEFGTPDRHSLSLPLLVFAQGPKSQEIA